MHGLMNPHQKASHPYPTTVYLHFVTYPTVMAARFPHVNGKVPFWLLGGC